MMKLWWEHDFQRSDSGNQDIVTKSWWMDNDNYHMVGFPTVSRCSNPCLEFDLGLSWVECISFVNPMEHMQMHNWMSMPTSTHKDGKQQHTVHERYLDWTIPDTKINVVNPKVNHLHFHHIFFLIAGFLTAYGRTSWLSLWSDEQDPPVPPMPGIGDGPVILTTISASAPVSQRESWWLSFKRGRQHLRKIAYSDNLHRIGYRYDITWYYPHMIEYVTICSLINYNWNCAL